MANVSPFRAIRYDPSKVEPTSVVTQPYDKITPEMQDRYYAASPYNLVRIILGKAQTADHSGENVYTRAAGFFQDWQRRGILRQDEQQSLYHYVQRFVAPGAGKELERHGFIGLGRIEDYLAHVVFRHEQTLAKPKADRLELLRATRAHFGQIFMLYSDPANEIERAMQSQSAPTIEVRDEYGVLHQLWQVSEREVIERVRGKMRDKKLIIADGHHRYETALNYRNQRREMARAAAVGAQENSQASVQREPTELPAYEHVMMTFINMDSPGLVILPTHRVIHGLGSFSAGKFRSAASSYFSVEEVDPNIDVARAVGILREAGLSGTAMLAVTADRAFLLDSPKSIGSSVFNGLSLRQQSLDVVQLHKCLLEGVLGISEEAIRNQENISYVRDAGEALKRVREGGANIAFLMNPVRIQQVRDIAFASEVLPQKSTDFYPKLLSGLTIYALE
jgi:uncharacterized protein (DUF1015 family)